MPEPKWNHETLKSNLSRINIVRSLRYKIRSIVLVKLECVEKTATDITIGVMSQQECCNIFVVKNLNNYSGFLRIL